MNEHEQVGPLASGREGMPPALGALPLAGRTLCDVLSVNARARGAHPALRHREDGRWRSVTWGALRRAVAEAALGLRALGVGPGDVLLVRSPPRPEAFVLDLAALHLRAIPVFVDLGGSAEQLEWTARHCGARALALSGPVQGGTARRLPEPITLDGTSDAAGERGLPLWDLLRTGRAALEADPGCFERLTRHVRPDDVATLCYGPAPDGSMRAAVVTHRAALWTAASVRAWARGAVGPGQTTVAHLPLSHSAGRLFGHYLVLCSALEAYCCPGTALLEGAVGDARPAFFVGVPLVWDRLARAAEGAGRLPPGLEACRLPVSAGGPLPQELAGTLRRAGLLLLNMYGLTETFGPVTAHRPGSRPRAGTVGSPMPGLDVLLDGGEVVVRTPAGATGYLHDAEATAATFGAGGTVRTGDLGHFETGELVLTGRRRELLVTMGGRNVPPRPLERALARHPGVRSACVVGEGRPYVAALIAVGPGVGSGPEAAGVARAAVERVNATLARGDQIRAFRVVAGAWGEPGPDWLGGRAVLERRYARVIDDLYGAAGDAAGTPA